MRKKYNIKRTFLVVILFLFVIKLNSQTTDYPQRQIDYSNIDISRIDFSFLNFEQFSFGFKLSPSIGWLNVKNTDLQADGAALKFGMGGIADYAINNNISVVSGVNYNWFGGYVFDNKSLNDPATKDNYKLNYTQVEVPLSLKLKTNKLNKISYYIQGGLNAGFIITANEEHQSISKNTPIKPTNINPLTNPNRIGYQVSVGSEYYFTNKFRIFGDICYKNSLSNIALSESYISSGIYSTPLEILPGSMEFTIGILFR